MRDFRVWWALFVFFGALSVIAVQRGYRRWSRACDAARLRPAPEREALLGRLRREGWRLGLMSASVVAMTALVFAALEGAAPVAILILRLAAVGSVAGVVWLSVRR